jgi:flagellar biosynthesis protein
MYDKREFQKRRAAALRYNKGTDSVPKVVASGKGHVADRIIEKAKEYDVPMFKNEALAKSLLDVDIGEKIPPKLYKTVAEVFIWLLSSEQLAVKEKEAEERANSKN